MGPIIHPIVFVLILLIVMRLLIIQLLTMEPLVELPQMKILLHIFNLTIHIQMAIIIDSLLIPIRIGMNLI